MPFKRANLDIPGDWVVCTLCGVEGIGDGFVRTHKCNPRYQSLHLLPEDERIKVMVEKLRALPSGHTGAIHVDDEPRDKADRYLRKISTACADLVLVKRFDGPTPGVHTLIFKRK